MNQKRGFSLALTMIMSVIILATLFGIFRVVTALYISSQENYYLKLAEEAGEAGTAYANACLDANNRLQTWGSASGGVGNLSPESNCRGQANAYAANRYVLDDETVRTTFSVGNLDYAQDNTVQISATGTSYAKSSSGNIIKTYTMVVKKSVTWPTNFIGQKSASGTYRTCAIITDNIWCWGRNRFGQLGNGKASGVGESNPTAVSPYDSKIPVKVRKDQDVLAGKRVDDIFTAQFHSCVLAEGAVYCWGYNGDGQLGNGNNGERSYSSVPVKVGGVLENKTVTAIGGSGNVSCAIAEGKIYCWGENYQGALGIGGGNNNYNTPQLITGGIMRGVRSDLPTNYTAISLSTSGSRSRNMCAVADGKAYCWGQNNAGQLGVGYTSTTSMVPLAVVGLNGLTVTSISQDGYFRLNASTPPESSYSHTCALASNVAYCWGNNSDGQVGIPNGWSGSTRLLTPARVNLPREIMGDSIISIEVGLYHTCFLSSSKKVYCMGINESGQLGINNSRVRSSSTPLPVKVGDNGIPSDVTVVNISAGANRGCATVSNGKTYCWGMNDGGQIGDNTTINRFTPTESLFLRPSNNRYIY